MSVGEPLRDKKETCGGEHFDHRNPHTGVAMLSELTLKILEACSLLSHRLPGGFYNIIIII